MLLIYRYVERFGPDLVHQLVPHSKKRFYFTVTVREIQTFITNISYVKKKVIALQLLQQNHKPYRLSQSANKLKHSETSSLKHLYIQEVTVHVAHKAASVLQTWLRKRERLKGLKVPNTTQAGGGEATSCVWGWTRCLNCVWDAFCVWSILNTIFWLVAVDQTVCGIICVTASLIFMICWLNFVNQCQSLFWSRWAGL